MRRLAAALAVAAAAATGCGGGEAERRDAPGPARLVTEEVGRGPQTATVIRPDAAGPLPVVLFLHGWGATRPRTYGPWIEHLARAGNAVIYPRYQDSVLTPPEQVLGNVIAGVRLALGRIEARPDSLVVAGHSAGGALSADYAAIAAQAGLPVPRAIFSAYPGRRLRGAAPSIPEVAPERIDPATRIVALGGARDTVVGTAPARRIVRAATAVPRSARRYVEIRDPAVSDHLGPQRAGEATRRTFWRRLDALIAAARR